MHLSQIATNIVVAGVVILGSSTVRSALQTKPYEFVAAIISSTKTVLWKSSTCKAVADMLSPIR